MQSEIAILGLLEAPKPLLEHQLFAFGDDEEGATRAAVLWAWMHRRDKSLTKSTAAQRCGIKAPHFTNIVNGSKHLPPHKINAYEWTMGNTAVSQTIARFKQIRERELVSGLARVVAQNMVRAA